MENRKLTIKEDVQYYAEFLDNKYGYVWDSHYVLGRMCLKHGKRRFMEELQNHWKKQARNHEQERD
jgi:hypothetical protein